MQKKKASRKEKPSIKTPIAGTLWIRVKTTAGNTFYTHTERKESVWEVPEEISDSVKALERQEVEVEAAKNIHEMEERMASIRETASQIGKRKATEETDRPDQSTGKKARVVSQSEEEGHKGSDEEEDDDQEMEETAAIQQSEEPDVDFAMVDVEEDGDVESEAAKKLPTGYNMPKQVTLSPEESRALFKVCIASHPF